MNEILQHPPETVWDDGEFTLSRAVREGDLSPVFVVVPSSVHPAPSSLARLENAYALRDRLGSEWAARPCALVHERGRPTLLTEDPGGEPLLRFIGAPMEPGRFLRIALGVVSALGGCHASGIIHKDLKPANIIVSPETGEAWLAGFGIAAHSPRERQAPDPPEVIAGTPAYMAPEQTGRMNRSIDSRSDLYALGVTFYQMLAGVLPFTAADPMGWVHCHVAKEPPLLSERSGAVPSQLSAIVMKLMAKTAEERYQTAGGLHADLRRCLEEWESTGGIEPFPLRAHDISPRLLFPEKLYGRESEVERLIEAFDRVTTDGEHGVVLVSGYAGIGKSSVISELHKALVPPRGLFAAGKFDQFQRDIPYATFTQACGSLIRRILVGSEAEVRAWGEALRRALGADAQLVVNLVPELALVIGEGSQAEGLASSVAQTRFRAAFRRFLGVFARPEHPLVLFLDDLQWLDPATLDLLRHLVVEARVPYLLLIGAYRDHELEGSHGLAEVVDSIRASGVRLTEIELRPLSRSDMDRLTADLLHIAPDRPDDLAGLVHERTEGNPLFALELLALLAEEELLTFDPDISEWQWNVDDIRARGYTDNVVDLIAGKLDRLPPSVRGVLEKLACIGNAAGLETIARVHGEPPGGIEPLLAEAVRAGFLLRIGEAWSFVHDRVQEAAYARIPAETRAAAHLEIGRLLMSEASEEEIQERIFEIVHQFNLGTAALETVEGRNRVAQLNVLAAIRAASSTAFSSAFDFLLTAEALLEGEENWTLFYPVKREIQHRIAMHEMDRGMFDSAAARHTEILKRSTENADILAAHTGMAHIHILKSEYPLAFERASTCLRLFGIDMPEKPTREQLDETCEEIWRRLEGRTIESLADLPDAVDERIHDIHRILSVLFSPAYVAFRSLAWFYPCHMVRLTLRHGVTPTSFYGFGYFGIMLGQMFGRYAEGYRFCRLALEIAERDTETDSRAGGLYLAGLAALWARPVAEVIDMFRGAFTTATVHNSAGIACNLCSAIVTAMHLRGDDLESVLRQAGTGLEFVVNANYRNAIDIMSARVQFIRLMRGDTPSFSSLDGGDFNEARFEAGLTPERSGSLAFTYWIVKGHTRFMTGDFVGAAQAFEHAGEFSWASVGDIEHFEYAYFEALTCAALDSPGASGDAGRRARLTELCERLALWAEHSPTSFADKHALIVAEIARLEGEDHDAMRHYERAIRLARESGAMENEGIANERAARFYRDRGFETIERTYLRNARYCYLRWGAHGKVRHMDQRHPYLSDDTRHPSYTDTIGASVDQFDAAAAIRASQALSSEIVLERVIETLMRLAAEHAGAVRGLLIVPHGDGHGIAAAATMGRDTIDVEIRGRPAPVEELATTVLHLVIRTEESVIVGDASADELFAGDEYIRRAGVRSILCLPLVNQARMMGILYLENNLAPHVFTSGRVAVLKLLASQAAISLENARLYGELEQVRERLYNENIALREEVDKSSMFEEIVGDSRILRAVLWRVEKVAPTDSTVLITGETGTGKELIARAIHKRSGRAERPFVSVNCAAIPQSLIASELFGHEKGAFTGALQRRTGRFELAAGGTIFLDEIGELPPETQVSLLRVLQEREFERVGGVQPIRSDVRVIAATNRDLPASIAAGTFRSDLYYRLNVFPIETPALRDRKEDIPLLVEYFIARFASKAGKHITEVSRRTLDLLRAYPWPGNIRELQNVIERSIILCDTPTFSVDRNWLSLNTERNPPLPESLTTTLQDQEKGMIESALAESRGRVSGPTGAAAKLGIPPSTLDSKIRALGIDKHRFRTRG